MFGEYGFNYREVLQTFQSTGYSCSDREQELE